MCTTSRLCRGCLECSTNWLPSSPSIVHRCQKHYVQLNSSLSPLPLSHHRTLTVAKAIYIVHKIINVKISVKLMALKPSTVSSRKQTGKLLVPHTQAHTHTHTHTRMHERAHTHAHTHTHSATPSSPLLSMSGTPFLPPPSSAISLDIFKCCVEGRGSFQILQAFNTP